VESYDVIVVNPLVGELRQVWAHFLGDLCRNVDYSIEICPKGESLPNLWKGRTVKLRDQARGGQIGYPGRLMSTPEHPFPNVDDLVARNADYAASLEQPYEDVRPNRNLAVVACMDSRMDIFSILGLENGEAHIIRNAGGIITDDAIRSLALSQRYLGTREIILLHHTDCGLLNLDVAKFNADFESDVGVRPPWKLEAFSDPYTDIQQSIRRLQISPFVMHSDQVTGFVYDVDTGLLDPV